MAGSRRTAARVTRGAICFEQLQPFRAHAVFELDEAGGVAARPRQAVDEAGADRIGDDARTRSARCGSPAATAPAVAAASGQDDVRRERQPIPPRICECARHRPRPSDSRSARCGPRSSPIAPAPAGKPRCGPVFRIVRRPGCRARRCAASRSPCCARAASGQARFPPRRRPAMMNSRRLIRSPRRRARAAGRYVEAERFRGREVDDQFEFGRQ